MRILFAEDDALLGAGLYAALGKAGFEVTWAKDGQSALELALGRTFDAVVLDIGLPVLGGMDVLRRLRAVSCSVPVLILTALDSTPSKVAGLEAGADDYLAKTAELDELIARVRALIRRAGRGTFSVGELTIDTGARVVTLRGDPVHLSRREFDVLRVPMEASGRVLTRGQLEQALYGESGAVDSNTIEVHIHNLRSKIGPSLLKTVRGVGYALMRPQS